MAKSPLARKKKSITRRETKQKDKVFDLDWLMVPFNSSLHNKFLYFDLSIFFHLGANKVNRHINERVRFVYLIAKGIQNKIKDGRTTNTYANNLFSFKKYIVFCDGKGIEPFSKEGYFAYLGDEGEVRRLIRLEDETFKFLFDCDDGEETGFSESNAHSLKNSILTILRFSGVYQDEWNEHLQQFSTKEKQLIIPYKTEVINNALALLFPIFDQLFKAHKEFYSINPDSPVPSKMEINVAKKGEKPNLHMFKSPQIRHSQEKPFNICMSIGYCLFSYYTALNQSVILNTAHPIEINKRRIKEKSVRYTSLSLWKSRSGKYISSMLSDETFVNDFENEIDINIEKNTGLKLVEQLKELAQMYGDISKGSALFFHLDGDGKPTGFNTSYVCTLSSLLDIRNEGTESLAHIFHAAFKLAHDKKQHYNVSVITSENGYRYVSKKVIDKGSRKINNELLAAASGLLFGFNDPYLIRDAITPLKFEPVDENGNIIAHFKRKDTSEGFLILPAKYESFIRSLDSWSGSLLGNTEGYLLPFRNESYQWSARQRYGRCPSINATLKNLGIRSGEYYLDLNTRRFRALTAKMEYNDDDKGYNASLVLQNSIETLDRVYSNGDPEENQVILHEAIEIASEIFKGVPKTTAIKKVKENLNITVLSFESYKKSKLYLNQNGFACTGKPDIKTGVGTNNHRSAAKRGEELGVVNNQANALCFQYDQCCFCKSAKMVDDPMQVYKTLSFIRVLEERVDQWSENAEELIQKATYFKLLVMQNISPKVVEEAESMLRFEGIHPLLRSMQTVQD